MPLRFEMDDQARGVLGSLSVPLLEEILEGLWDELVTGSGNPAVIGVSLSAVDQEKMRELNVEYRGLPEPTDVLSFPLWETDDGGVMAPRGWPEIELGDIVLCPEVVAENARTNGREFTEELLLVLVHGVLHLFGLDHQCEEDRARMWKVQDDLVDAYGARRASVQTEEE